MKKEEQIRFDDTTVGVNNILKIVINLFQKLGIEGMKDLIDPSFEEIAEQISDMKKAAIKYQEDFLKEREVSNNSILALMFMQNINQGILFAENLLIAVKNENLEDCLKQVSELKKINITSPAWE